MLDELEYDYNAHIDTSADKNLAVRFYMHPLQNKEKSAEAKRPIFEDTEFVEIRVRGDRNFNVQRPAHDGDRERFRAAYRAFKDGDEQAQQGTPLAEWPSMTRSMVEELKFLGFFTVEQLANASDSVCAKYAGLQSLKSKANAWIEHAKGAPAIDRLTEELEAARNVATTAERNMQAMNAQIEKMAAQIEALSKRK
jgi:hypothetical protein